MSKLILPYNTKTESKEEIPTDSGHARQAKSLVKGAGVLLTPEGLKWIGAAVIHYYMKPVLGNEHHYGIITQLNVEGVPEAFADYGHKQMQKGLMAAYGKSRKERK